MNDAEMAKHDADQLALVAKLAADALNHVTTGYQDTGALADPAWIVLVHYIVEHAPPSAIRDRYIEDLGLA